MKRNNFFTSLIAILATPIAGFALLRNPFKRNDTGFKVEAGESRSHGHIKLKGVNANILDVKISGDDTDGALAVFEQTSLSPGRGTPLHVHPLQDEMFYVIEGSYYFQVGETKYTITTGDNIFLPRAVPHAWTQVSEKGKMIVLFQPAGKMENFFVTVANMDHEPTPAEMAKHFTDNEMKIVGPPLKVE